MGKAVISNRIYLDNPGIDASKHIIKELTYKIKHDRGSKQFSTVETIKTYKVLVGGILSIPQGRLDLIPQDYTIIDKRVQISVPFPDPVYPLRPEQQVVYNEVNDTAFINALVGWGKTFTALHIAHKLGQKTLIVTHTTALRDQWAEEIEALFGTTCGIIGSGKIDHEDHFITVSNTQTLVKHAESLAKEFGCIIIDEAHHIPATTFSTIIDSFYARYRIALSGTMTRKDGKHIMFKDYFGNHIIKPPQSNTLTPTVKLVRTGITLKPNAPWTDKISELVSDDKYQRFIASVALSQMSIGHQVLVIADRVDFLKQVKEYIGETCLLVTGETDFESRKLAKEQLLSGEKQSVCGSRQIFSEGISINSLSCVILAVPISNDALLEQIIGRIQRVHSGKLAPLVIDPQFHGWADKKQNNDRLGLYLRKGWQIVTI